MNTIYESELEMLYLQFKANADKVFIKRSLASYLSDFRKVDKDEAVLIATNFVINKMK